MRLPQYTQQVQVQNLPGPHIDTSAPASAFGAGLGAGLQSAGNDIAQVAIHEQAQADTSAVSDALAALDDYDTAALYGSTAADGTASPGITGLSGKTAMAQIGPTVKGRDSAISRIRSGLTDRQRALFDRESRSRTRVFKSQIARSQARAGAEAADDSHKNAQESFKNKIGPTAATMVTAVPGPTQDGSVILDTSYTDEVIKDALRENDAYWSLNGGRFGDPEGEHDKEQAELLNTAHGQVLDALLAQGKTVEAASYFVDKKKELSGDALDHYQSKITAIVAEQEVTAVSAAALSQFTPEIAFEPQAAGSTEPTLSEREKAGRAWIKATIEDKEQQEKALDRFAAEVSRMEGAADAQRREWSAALDAEIAAGKSWEQVVLDERYQRLEVDQQKGLATYFKARAEGQFAVTPDKLYDEITSEMTDDQDEFLKRDFRQMARSQEISEADARAWEGVQVDIVKGRGVTGATGSGYAGVITPEEQINRRAEELFKKDSQKEQRGAYKAKVNAILRAQFTTKDAKPSYEAVQKVLDDTTTEVVYAGGTRLKDAGGRGGLGLLLHSLHGDEDVSFSDISEQDALRAIAAMRAGGYPVTPSNVVRYLAREKDLAGE